jgi:hypothetical protein
MDQAVIASVKQCYWDEVCRTLADEDDRQHNSIMEKNYGVDTIYGIFRAQSSINQIMLIRSWRKLLSDLKDYDLQGFPNEEISKSKILDMVCAMRSFKNVDKDNIDE